MLTIAIPVFERTQYFEKALNSVLQQTYKCKVIVVDNASSHDFFKDICIREGIEYVKNESNIGVFPNWNLCVSLSKTEFVLILSDDDILETDYVERFTKTIEQYPDLDLFYSDFSTLNYPSLQITNNTHILPFGYSNNGNNVIEYGIRYKLGFPVITSAIRKSKFSGFYNKEHGSNDWVWVYSNIQNFKIFGDEKKLIQRGIHDSNDSYNPITLQRTSLSIAYLYDYLISFAKTEELKRLAKRNRNAAFSWFLFIADNTFISQLNESKLLYANFFKKMLSKSNTGILKYMPLSIRKNLYRIAIRVGLIDRM